MYTVHLELTTLVLHNLNRPESQPWELTAENACVHCGLSIKPYEIPKKEEGV